MLVEVVEGHDQGVGFVLPATNQQHSEAGPNLFLQDHVSRQLGNAHRSQFHVLGFWAQARD